MASGSYNTGNKTNRSLDPDIDYKKVKSLAEKEFDSKMKWIAEKCKTAEEREGAFHQELYNCILSSKLKEAKYLVTRDAVSRSFVKQDKLINELNALKFSVKYRK